MAAPARVPQAVRSARTRTLLLDATVECLAELGYAGTTTTEVCRRAGVSRGAQLHHFPTKVELVSAAAWHTLEQRMAQMARTVAAAPPGTDRIHTAIDVVWSIFRESSVCDAWVELAVACRTDPELRTQVAELNERHRQVIEAMWDALFADIDRSGPFAPVATKFLLALMDGLVLHRMSGYDDGPGRADAVVEAAKALASLAFGDAGSTPA